MALIIWCRPVPMLQRCCPHYAQAQQKDKGKLSMVACS